MIDNLYLGAYWGPRPESVNDCAGRLLRCLNGLADAHPLLSQWYLLARTKAAARVPVEPDPETLRSLLLKGRSRTDFGGEVMEQLGYGFSMWNKNSASVGLSGTAGGYPAMSIPNNFVLEFPDPTGPGAELYEPSTLQRVFDVIVDAWDPDWAVLTTHLWRDAQKPGQNEPQIGWMNYIAESPRRHLPVSVPGAEPFHHGMRLRQGFSPGEVTTEQILETRDHFKSLGALTPTAWVLPDGTVPLPPQAS